jgi:hypothetical protein
VLAQDFCGFVMEEDPEMQEAAGISLPGTSTAHNSVNIQKTIESAISSVPGFEGSNVTVKVCVMGIHRGTVNFWNWSLKWTQIKYVWPIYRWF